jgi:hypothetical protein
MLILYGGPYVLNPAVEKQGTLNKEINKFKSNHVVLLEIKQQRVRAPFGNMQTRSFLLYTCVYYFMEVIRQD